MSGGVVYFGSGDHNVYALDQRTGALRWKFATGGRVSASPAVAGGTLYIGSFDGNFYALDAASGSLRWKFATEGERRFSGRHLHGAQPAAEVMPDPFDLFLSSPGGRQANTVYFGSGDGNVYALDAGPANAALEVSHRQRRACLAGGRAGHGVRGQLGQLFLCARCGQRQAALALQDRRGPQDQQPGGHPVLGRGRGRAWCTSAAATRTCTPWMPASGAQRWAFDNKGSWVISSPAVRGGKRVLRNLRHGDVHALDAKTGACCFELTSIAGRSFLRPRSRATTLYIGSHAGKLHRDRPEGRQERLDLQPPMARRAECRRPDQGRRLTELRGGLHGLLLRRHGRRRGSHAERRARCCPRRSSTATAVYFGSWDGQLYALG